MSVSNWIFLLLLEVYCLLSTHSLSTYPTIQEIPSHDLTTAKEVFIVDQAYKRLIGDLNSLPRRRSSIWEPSSTASKVSSHHNGLMRSLETCPTLKDLYFKEGSSSYCKELIEVVGPLSKYRLMEMIVKHPHLIAKALTSDDLRVCCRYLILHFLFAVIPTQNLSFLFSTILCSQHTVKSRKM